MKKNTLTDKAIDKQKKILIIAIFLVITLFIGSSYALLTNFDKTDNVITIKSGNLTMTIAADTVNLNNKLPESDEDGLKGTTTIITLTNTGTMNIEGYDVKLVNETGTDNVSTLDNKYIKYAISLDNTTFSDPQILSSNNNIIYTGYNLAVNASKTLYLKVWIDNGAGNNAINKTFYGTVKVDLYQKSAEPASNIIKARLNDTNSVTREENGVTYLAGTNETMNFNYVWYSGKLWRVTAINPDGTMKMITDGPITAIDFGDNGDNNNFYDLSTNTSAPIYQWLNEDFLDTLYNYQNIIVENSKWYLFDYSAIEIPKDGLEGVTTITAKVGLLNETELYLPSSITSIDYTNGNFLSNKYYWWSLNRKDITDAGLDNSGEGGAMFNIQGVRPMINIKNTVKLSGGDGTIENPYTFIGDKEEAVANTTLLNTRTSGEYVIFDEDGNSSTKELYRIVGIEDGLIKINKVDYVRDTSSNVITKMLSTTANYGDGTSDDYWDYYLNNTWYNSINSNSKNLLTKGTYYLGNISYYNTSNTRSNYKDGICANKYTVETTKKCAKTTAIWNLGYVGLPRVGEMFASQLERSYENSSDMWLITNATEGNNDVLQFKLENLNGGWGTYLTDKYAVRPSLYLKSTVKITGGDGTKSNPFTISV